MLRHSSAIRWGLVAVLLGLLLVPMRGTLALAGSSSVWLDSSQSPLVGAPGTIALSSVPLTTTLPLVFPLRLSDGAGLSAFAQSAATPGSPQFGHFLSLEQVLQRYGPAAGSAAAIVGWLRANGITTITSSALSVQARASVAQINSLLGIRLSLWRSAQGNTFMAPNQAPAVPNTIAPLLTGVLGLQTASRVHPHLLSPATRPLLGPAGGYTPTDLRAAYNLAPLTSAQVQGQGQAVDVYELTGYTPSTIATYDAQYGTGLGSTTPIACQTPITSSSFTCTANSIMAVTGGSGEAEVESDIEVLHAIAPQASINVYQAPNTDVDGYNLYQTIVTAHDAPIVSTSWGLCELDTPLASMQSQDQLFSIAAAIGIAVLAAAGDAGDQDCNGDGTINQGQIAVDFPASDPSVTAVGGTNLALSRGIVSSETVWNTGGGGTGGGVSTIFPLTVTAPITYQQGLRPPGIVSTTMRMLPDVTADGDPATGYSIDTGDASFCFGASTPCWTVIAGTSLSTPLWAGLLTLANQERGTALGFANPTLYALGRSSSAPLLFRDIVSGTNDLTQPTSPPIFYPAGAGYDLTSGWGSPNGAALASTIACLPGATSGASSLPHATCLPLQTGWNLVSVPLSSSGTLTAQSLLSSALSVGGASLAELASWTGTGWQVAIAQPGQSTNDFSLSPTSGYFLYIDQPVTATALGVSASPPTSVTVQAGWNLIGLPTAPVTTTAQSVLTSLAAAGAQPLEIAAWMGTNWQVALAGQAADFAIKRTSGYFVYLQQTATWRPPS